MMSGLVGQEAEIALFLQETRIRKIRKNLRIKLVDYCPKQGDHYGARSPPKFIV